MSRAILVAKLSAVEVPVGAVVLDPMDSEIAISGNRVVQDSDPTGHAEMIALRDAMRACNSRTLEGATLIVTLEPCPMCTYAAREYRVGRIVFGAANNKTGACGSRYDLARDSRLGEPIEVFSGVLANQSEQLLRRFFEDFR